MAFLMLLWISLSVVVSAIDYSDLQGLGATCYPRDTCNRSWKTFPNASCECDNLCLSYNDCCFDAPVITRGVRIQLRVGLTCLSYREHGVFAVKRCPTSWAGAPIIRRRCENKDDFSDPLLAMPVTDPQTHITYRNRYCAECNNANRNNLSTWSPTLTCESLKPVDSEHHNITLDFIVRNIDRVGHYWGVYHWNQNSSGMTFYPCDVSFSLPASLEKRVRKCAPDVVSTCAQKWSRENVRQKCHAYMAVVFVNDKAYRNAHCALCNLGSTNSVQCLPPTVNIPTDIFGRKTPPLSFTLLVDVNPRDGNTVGVTNPCPSGQKYDPFFKKCRTLVCALPGHVLRNDRCVPQ